MSLLDSIFKKTKEEPKKPAAAKATGPKDGTTTKRIAPKQEQFCHYDKDGRLIYYYLTDFDENDKPIHKAAYGPTGALINELDYVYNEHGDEVWGTWDFYSGGYLYKLETKYDEKFRPVDCWSHGETSRRVVGFRSIMHYEHDDDKVDYTEIFNCDEDGTRGPVSIYRNQWNEDRTQISILLIYHEGEQQPSARRLYEYDEAGHRTKDTFEEPPGTLGYTDVTRYDKDGNKIDITRYDKDGKLQSVQKP